MNESAIESVYRSFRKTAEARADKTALVYLGTKWSFTELRRLVDQFASALASNGVKAGECVVLNLPNIPQWTIAFLALQRVRAIPVVAYPYLSHEEILEVMNRVKAGTVICTDTNFGHIMQVKDRSPLKRIIVTTLTELLPKWKRVINFGLQLVPRGKISRQPDIYSFSKMLNQSVNNPGSKEGEGEDTALICFTSGIEGVLKAVPFTNSALLESSLKVRTLSESVVPKGESTYLLGCSLCECLGAVTAVGCLANSGETLILVPEENTDAFMAIIQRNTVTHLLGSADLYQGFLGNSRSENYDLNSLQYCLNGGDSLPKGIAEGWKKKFNKTIYTTYTLTEAHGSVACSPPVDNMPVGSSGKILPSIKLRLVNQLTQEEAETNQPGEILVSSANTIREYWNDPEETEKAFVRIDNELWFKTGDIGRVDENGWFYFISRKSDIIHRDGKNIVAAEIERLLEDHPDVIRASVVGVPDPELGQRIKAYLVLSSGTRGITSQKLMNWCEERMEANMIPQYIEFRDMLPTSKDGKLLKRELLVEE